MKIAIDCVHYPISKNLASHRASWAKYWKYYLETKGNKVDILYRGDEDKWDNYDAIYLYHGMEFNGKLNLAGGVGDWHIARFNKFAEWMMKNPDKPVYSIEHTMPDYYELLHARKIDIPKLYGQTDRIKRVDLPGSNYVVLGDSHSLSAMLPLDEPFVRVYRTDFKSLFGALRIGLENMIDFTGVRRATFYFGNIDLRHHLLRHDEPAQTILDLVEEYVIQLTKIQDKFKTEIEVVGLLPMTKDTRKLPKSGYYEGTPFYGALEDRIRARETFNDMLKGYCKAKGWNFFEWPTEFEDSDGTLNEQKMEKPRSVHMAQTSYRYDLENNEVRYA